MFGKKFFYALADFFIVFVLGEVYSSINDFAKSLLIVFVAMWLHLLVFDLFEKYTIKKIRSMYTKPFRLNDSVLRKS